MSNTAPYIKIGDNFDVPVQLVDVSTGQGIYITSDFVITTRIINLSGVTIATPTIVKYPDQEVDTGYLLMSVPSSVTATWKTGKAKLDIKLILNGSIRHSYDFAFNIIEAIT